MIKTPLAPTQRLLLDGEPWETYSKLLRLFDERRHLRITYDRGALELMTLSAEHERAKHLIGTLIIVLAYDLGLPIAGYGSLTFKRRRKQRGLEPDECYWIRNEAKVRNLTKFSFRRDPPPDLVVEVDISASSLNRLLIYAVMGVLEVWRYDGDTLGVYILGADRKYTIQDRSMAFPFLRPADLLQFLAMYSAQGETEMVRTFRTWVQQQEAAGWRTS